MQNLRTLLTRPRWIPSSLVSTGVESDTFDAFVPPPPVNIIHPKPTVSSATRHIVNFLVIALTQYSSSLVTDAHQMVVPLLTILKALSN